MSRTELLEYMKTAIDEARNSLREGNNGFGAVIVKDGRIVSSTHDLEETENDDAGPVDAILRHPQRNRCIVTLQHHHDAP